MRLLNPHHEKEVARRVRQYGYSRRQAMLEVTGCDTLGQFTKQRLDFHLTDHPQDTLRRHTRIRAGLAMGYGVYRILPVEDLRNLHHPVRGKAWLRYFDLLPKGMMATDLAAFNVYLEEIVRMEPCPFSLLLRQSIWEEGIWRDVAKESVLWGSY
ncbi:MAG: hypothetical protein GC129_02035 [Proteobacteria bacterium]|nr:hypothetical protein [Pseudomonadota bacterium]